MISKQDMVAARTPADLERRYNLRKSFGEAMNLATDARKAAEEADRLAQEAAEALKGLNQEEVFRILTNNGEAKGVFRDEDGQIYINASYIAAGIIASADGSVKLDLLHNALIVGFENTDRPYFRIKANGEGVEITFEEDSGPMHQLEIMSQGIKLKAWNSDTDMYETTVHLLPGNAEYNVPTIINSGSNPAGLMINRGMASAPLYIDDKAVSWKDNGDGTYTLTGTD